MRDKLYYMVILNNEIVCALDTSPDGTTENITDDYEYALSIRHYLADKNPHEKYSVVRLNFKDMKIETIFV